MKTEEEIKSIRIEKRKDGFMVSAHVGRKELMGFILPMISSRLKTTWQVFKLTKKLKGVLEI